MKPLPDPGCGGHGGALLVNRHTLTPAPLPIGRGVLSRLFARLTCAGQKTSVPAMRRRISAQGWTRAAIAVVMAYAFVLQALLLSVSGAVHAAAAEPQGIICLQDGASAPDHSPAQAHKNLCCTLSCHGSGAAGPVPAATILDRVVPLAVASVPSPDRPGLRLTSNVLPLGSRAPPRLG